jgi:hypothetical protein
VSASERYTCVVLGMLGMAVYIAAWRELAKGAVRRWGALADAHADSREFVDADAYAYFVLRLESP